MSTQRITDPPISPAAPTPPSTALDYLSPMAAPRSSTTLRVLSALNFIASSLGVLALASLLFVIGGSAQFSPIAFPVLSLVFIGAASNILAWLFLRDHSRRGWVRARNCLLVSSLIALALSAFAWISIHAQGDRDPMTVIISMIVLTPLFALPTATLIALTAGRAAEYFAVRRTTARFWFCIGWLEAGLWIAGAATLLGWRTFL